MIVRPFYRFETGWASTLAFEKQWNGLLGLDRDAFVDTVAANVPAKPAEMESILRFNQGRSP